LCVFFSVLLCGCTYYPPEGFTEEHHTYEEILAYAKTLDSNAVVSEKYTDSVDEYDWEYREWPAVINGVECHVASKTDWVFNSGLFAGEFIKNYYKIDTDYDYLIMEQLITEKQPQWKMSYSDISGRYHNNDIAPVEVILSENKALNEQELESVWNAASEINTMYRTYPVHKEAWFCIPAPEEYYDDVEETYFLRIDSNVVIDDFSEDGKERFIQEYWEAWALLDSDLPIVE